MEITKEEYNKLKDLKVQSDYFQLMLDNLFESAGKIANLKDSDFLFDYIFNGADLDSALEMLEIEVEK